ncbi:MAG: glycosyl transferase family 1 [Desulfobulbaceae bacterium BRH_c16a]|nr:MAG: glycosyl transferase family 1 [Desulfobulbaceae bacterium BRH_c16a]
MNISMFTNTYLPHVGGVARSISTFAEDLRKAGHRVQIVAPTYAGLEEVKEKDIVRVPAFQNFNGSDFSVRIPFTGVINRAITDFRPDIIHSHHPFLLGDTALRVARSLDLPLVFTHHTLYEKYTHYVPFDSDALKRFVIQLATEYANLCHRVIAPSTDVKKLLISRGVQTIMNVLPTGIDVDFFKNGDGKRFRREHGIPEDTMVIGHVGRLAKEKNLPFLAGAVARALRKYGNACFLVAGKGDAEPEIKEIFEEQRLDKRLIMAGSLTGNNLADCYAAMDIFAFASLSETQGLVLAEAMAAATPVVALSASGVNDVMKDGVNGIRLEENTSEGQFGDALAQALADRKQLLSWSRNAFETAKTFSREKSTETLLQLYTKTISGVQNSQVAEIDVLDGALLAIKTEWELLQEKTAAALNSFSEVRKER